MNRELRIAIVVVFFLCLNWSPLYSDIFPEENLSVQLGGAIPGMRYAVRPVKYGDLYHPDTITSLSLCDTEEAGYYKQYCEEYEIALIPLSVSIKPSPGRTVRELMIDIEIRCTEGDGDGQTIVIKDVFPHNDEETKDYRGPFSLKVTSGAEGTLLPTVETTSIGTFTRVLYSVRSGLGSTEAFWIFEDKRTNGNALVGQVRMAVLAMIKRSSAGAPDIACPLAIDTNCDISFDRSLGVFPRKFDVEFTSAVDFPQSSAE